MMLMAYSMFVATVVCSIVIAGSMLFRSTSYLRGLVLNIVICIPQVFFFPVYSILIGANKGNNSVSDYLLGIIRIIVFFTPQAIVMLMILFVFRLSGGPKPSISASRNSYAVLSGVSLIGCLWTYTALFLIDAT